MSGKMESLYNSLFGLAQQAATSYIAVGATTASGIVSTSDENEVLRLCSSVDCYYSTYDPLVETNLVTTSGVFLPASTPEYISTGGTKTGVAVIAKSTLGGLHVTVMKSRGK
jgi:hypothetical protein